MNFTFAYKLNPETVKGITLVEKGTDENEDAEIPVIAEYDGDKTVKVRLASPLKKIQGMYLILKMCIPPTARSLIHR